MSDQTTLSPAKPLRMFIWANPLFLSERPEVGFNVVHYDDRDEAPDAFIREKGYEIATEEERAFYCRQKWNGIVATRIVITDGESDEFRSHIRYHVVKKSKAA